MSQTKKIPHSRRRVERANVKDRLQGVFLRVPELSAQDLRVVNVSEHGLGVETAGIKQAPAAGAPLEGKFTVGRGAPIAVQVAMVHMTPQLTGFQFVEPSELLRSAIRTYFEPELVGANLRPVSAEPVPSIRLDEGQSEIRFEDASQNRVSLRHRNAKLLGLQIEVLGNSVEWSQNQRLALFQNGRKDEVPEHLRKQLVKMMQSVYLMDPALRVQAERVLMLLPPEDEA